MLRISSGVDMWNSFVDVDIYLYMILYNLYSYCTPLFIYTYTLLKYRLLLTYMSLKYRLSLLYTPISENFPTNQCRFV